MDRIERLSCTIIVLYTGHCKLKLEEYGFVIPAWRL
jgi:hypothetical protein